jgi:hypothetical protein
MQSLFIYKPSKIVQNDSSLKENKQCYWRIGKSEVDMWRRQNGGSGS